MKPSAEIDQNLHNKFTFIRQLSKLLIGAEELTQMTDEICKLFSSMAGFDFAYITLFNINLNFEHISYAGNFKDRKYLEAALAKNKIPPCIKNAIDSNQLQIVNSTVKYGLQNVDYQKFTYLVNVLQHSTEIFGVIGVLVQKNTSWSNENFELFNELCNDIAATISRIKQSHDFTEMLKQSPDGYVMLDSKLNILEVNPAFCEIMEMDRKDLVGVNGIFLSKKIFSGKNLKSLLKAAGLLLKGKTTTNFEVSYGEKFLSVSTNFKSFNKYRFAVVRDVTKIRKAEILTRDNEIKYRNLANGLNASVMIVCDGKIVLVNKHLCKVSGYTEKELIGKDFLIFVAPESRDKIAELHNKRLADKKVPLKYELLAITKSGKKTDVEVTITKTTFEDKPSWQVVVRDISKLKAWRKTVEAAHDDLAKAQQIAKLGSWSINLSTQKVVASEQAYDIYGVSVDKELTYDDIKSIPLPEYRQVLNEALQNLISGKKAYNLNFRICKQNSGEILDVHSIAEYDKETNVVSGIIQDVTQLRESERKLKATLKELNDAQKLADIGSWSIDLNKNRVYASDQTRVLYGFEPDEIVSPKDVQQVHLPEYREKLEIALGKLIQGKAAYNEIFQLKNKKTGKIFDIHSLAEFDAEKKVVTGVLMNITERKNAEDAIKKSESKYRALFEAINDSVFIQAFSEDGYMNFIEVNDIACKHLGYTREELLTMNPNDITIKKDAAYYEKPKQRLKLVKNKSRLLETVHVAKNGQQIPVEISSRVFKMDGRYVIMSLVRDITERKWIEQEINNIATNFSHIFNVSNDTIALLDFNLGIAEVNQTFIERMKYNRAELLGQSITLICPDYPEKKMLKQLTDLRKSDSNTVLRYNSFHQTKSGEKFPVEVTLKIIEYNGKEVVLSVAHDITERVKAEKKLVEQKNFLWLLIDNLPIQIFWKNKDLVYRGCNQTFANVVGFNMPKDVRGKTDADFNRKPDYNEEYLLRDREIIKGKKPVYNRKEKYFNAEGKEGYAITSVIPYYEDNGEIIGLLGFSLDVTEIRKAEEEIAESEAKFRNYIEYAPYGVFVVNEKGKYIEVNKAATDLTGYTKEELTSLSIPDVCLPEELDYALNAFKKMVNDNVPINIDLHYKRKDGAVRQWSINASKIGHNRYLGFSEDITERKQNQKELVLAKNKAEESDRLKSAFLASVSHELRTPLNHILGFSDLIPELTKEKEVLEFASYINKSGQNLLEVVEDIFNLAMIEQRQIKIRNNEVKIGSIFDELKTIMQESLNDANKADKIALKFTFNKELVDRTIVTDNPKLF